ASTMAVLGYYGDWVMEDELAKELKADPNNGTPYKNIVSYAESKGYTAKVKTGMSIEALKAHLDAKQPVIVLIQAWGERTKPWSETWDAGHYVVAIGYDAERVYFMDPIWAGSY